MEDKVIEEVSLEDLKNRASELTGTVESLATLFEQEATRLKREEEAARLRALCSLILERVRRERELERAFEIGDHLAEGAVSLVRLAAGLVTMTFKDRTMQAISRELLTGPNDRELRFGTVLVRVGPAGVPDDVDIVSISELARQSERDEQAVIDGLLAKGNLLLGEKAFPRLMDGLADKILKGELSLPVSPERLWELREWRPLQLSLKNEV